MFGQAMHYSSHVFAAIGLQVVIAEPDIKLFFYHYLLRSLYSQF